MNNLDLNINNYSLDELKLFFKIDGTETDNGIQKLQTMLESIKNNKHQLTVSDRVKLLEFIAAASLKLGKETKTILPINPINIKTTSQILTIDTKFRQNYYNSDSCNFSFNLPYVFKNVISMSLVSMEFINTIYNISKKYGNNHFTFSVNNIRHTIIVPCGLYTSLSIILCLNLYFKNLEWPLNSFCLTNDIDNLVSGTGKTMAGINIDRVVSEGHTMDDIEEFSIDFACDINGIPDKATSLTMKFGWLLGFRNGYYVGAGIREDSSWTYISEGICNVSESNYFYFILDEFSNNKSENIISLFENSVVSKNIMAKIVKPTSKTPTYGTELQNKKKIITTPRKYFGSVDISKLEIRLIDQYGRQLSLNDMDYSFSLLLECNYNVN